MFDFFRRKIKIGDRVKTTYKGESMTGTVSSVKEEPAQKWYGITLDDGHYVSRPEESVERAKEDAPQG